MSGHAQGVAGDPVGDIVISGMAGRFPGCDSVEEFGQQLLAGVDLVAADDRRWPRGLRGLPERAGKLKGDALSRFDAQFFGVLGKQAASMDPQQRLVLELTHEALVDAGLDADELRGSRTAVFVGAYNADAERRWTDDPGLPDRTVGYALTGCGRSMLANRVSFAFDFKGPSCTLDTACSSSLFALQHAVKALRGGECDAALVAGCNVLLDPSVSLQFLSFGMLSPRGECRAFDAAGDGFVRSEAVVVLLLQRAAAARRIYATIVGAGANSDGRKEQGITFPSGEAQRALMQSVYQEAGVDPATVAYVEAHGTGTKVGDPQEANAIAEVFCTEGRTGPLLLGSVKSNMGHGEAASGLCGVAKVLLAMEKGVIPANLHFEEPNQDIPALSDGRLRVVTANTAWEGGLAAVSSFGFGGTNAHVVLRSNPTGKAAAVSTLASTPRLVVASGRTEEAVHRVLDAAARHHADDEFLALLALVHARAVARHPFRGYALVGDGRPSAAKPVREVAAVVGAAAGGRSPRPVWWVFPGMGCQWPGMATAMMWLQPFAKAVTECAVALVPYGVDLLHVLTAEDPAILESLVNRLVSITAVQVALVDTLRALGLEPDGLVGHSLGELGCAYADGALTAEQAVLGSYWRARCVVEAGLAPGAMATVGLGWEEAEACAPADVVVACHNTADSVSVSGPPESVSAFCTTLRAKGVRAQELPSCGFAFHSKYVADAGPALEARMRALVPQPAKLRGARWRSSAVPERDWGSALAARASATYFAQNLVSPVLFAEALRHAPEDAVVVEVGPHAILRAAARRTCGPRVTSIGLMRRGHPDNLSAVLAAVGKLYIAGAQPQPGRLLPPVQLPVSRGTPMLAPSVGWDHAAVWPVPDFTGPNHRAGGVEVLVDPGHQDADKYLLGHTVDGRLLFPAAGYMTLAWQAFAAMLNKRMEDVAVVLEDVRFLRVTLVAADRPTTFLVNVNKYTGAFEICESDGVAATGWIHEPDDDDDVGPVASPSFSSSENGAPCLNATDVYKELRVRGYEYSGAFRGIVESDNHGSEGRLRWAGNWTTFLDTVLQFGMLAAPREMRLPTRVQRVFVDPQRHKVELGEAVGVPVVHDGKVKITRAGGVEVCGVETTLAARRRCDDQAKLEKHVFVPYVHGPGLQSALAAAVQIVAENADTVHIKIIEIGGLSQADSLISGLVKAVLGEPALVVDATVVSADPLTEELEEMGVQRLHPDDITTGQLPANATGNNIVLASRTATVSDGRLRQAVMDALSPGGFVILVVEHGDVDKAAVRHVPGLTLVARLAGDGGDRCLLMLRKDADVVFSPSTTVVIPVTASDFSWLEPLKEAMACSEEQQRRIVLLSQQQGEDGEGPPSGVLGMANCLFREPGGQNIRVVLVQDRQAPAFCLDAPLYADQLAKDLRVNVLRDGGVWGSYRHVPVGAKHAESVLVRHAFVDALTPGDLSSLRWIQGPSAFLERSPQLCVVHFAALNFKDVMLASGKLPPEPRRHGDLAVENCVLGLEFSGRDRSGRRVMAMVTHRGLATTVLADSTVNLMWEVPDHWSLQEAATVPICYATAYYALVMRGRMRRGESVLIHCGAGGVGQAAIAIALHAGLTVFTTVGSESKRDFLKSTFPQLDDAHIASSRDASFERLVMAQTGGRGVDLVLNSLTGKLLGASVRCVARQGRFLEIGKYDLVSGNGAQGVAALLLRNASFHGVMLDDATQPGSSVKAELVRLVDEGIRQGAVRPLPATVFTSRQAEQAFRYLGSGKHIGKVVLRIQDEEDDKDEAEGDGDVHAAKLGAVAAVPRSYMHPDKSYVLIGGLGGFGLELAHWLVLRGARKLVLTSRSGMRTGYQALCVRRWRERGVNVLVRAADCGTEDGARQLLAEAAGLLGPVGGVFQLAVALRDAHAENMSEADFAVPFGAKGAGTARLDAASRALCAELDHFVCFSSATSGRGNAGQSNYGFANSSMERLCEARRAVGLPGLAIQWGAVGDVGVLAEAAEMAGGEADVRGTRPQRIQSCLDAMDVILAQSEPVVASMVLAPRCGRGAGVGGVVSVVAAVSTILGLSDADALSATTETLSDLGLDSIMGSEVKRLLERDFGLYLTAKQIRKLTLAELTSLCARTPLADGPAHSEPPAAAAAPHPFCSGTHLLPTEVFVEMATPPAGDCSPLPAVFIVHSVDGFVDELLPLARALGRPAFGLQFTAEVPLTSIEDVAAFYVRRVRAQQPRGPYDVAGYSFGTSVAWEMALQLEAAGEEVALTLLDASPAYMVALGAHLRAKHPDVQAYFLANIACIIRPELAIAEVERELASRAAWEDRLAHVVSLLRDKVSWSSDHFAQAACIRNRKVLMGDAYSPVARFNGHALLVRATDNYLDVSEDYGLSEVCSNPVKIHYITGNHNSLSEERYAARIANLINLHSNVFDRL